MIPWWMDNSELAAFCDWMHLQQGASAADVIAIVREPWEWTTDYQMFVEGRSGPSDGDAGNDEELSGPGQAA